MGISAKQRKHRRNRRLQDGMSLAFRGAALLACLMPVAKTTLLASSRLERCVASSSSHMDCSQRFVITLTVNNGQNATESVATYKLTHATDDSGNVYDFLDSMEMSLAKSQVTLNYPLTYQRNYNNKPLEIVKTKDSAGRSFNALTNKCVDDVTQDGACGWVLDNGARVPYSNGFCCRCNIDDYFASSGTGSPSRANLDCALFSSSNSQSAHCLRMDPLWYAAFEIQAHSVQYTIDLAVKRCRKAANSTAESCVFDIVKLSPSAPGACQTFTALPGSTSVSSSASNDCDVFASLEGDFAAFDAAPELASKLLMSPLVCDDFAACGARMLENSERWLLVDKQLTTLGSECDKIGVSYSAFQSQGSRCNVPAGTCLRHQIEEYYQEDLTLFNSADTSRTGKYWLQYALGGQGTYTANIQSPSSKRLTLRTNRFQKSVVTLVVDADSIRWIQRVSPGIIVRAVIPSFEAMGKAGILTVDIKNTGDLRSLYTIAVDCASGSQPIQAISAVQVTLLAPPSPGSQSSSTFPVQTETMEAGVYTCTVTLQDGLFRVTDKKVVSFNTTATKQSAGEQGGTLSPGAPGAADGDAVNPPVSCSDRCKGGWDLACAVNYRCFSIIGGWIGGLLGVGLFALLAFKFPWLILGPLRMCSSLCCGGGNRSNGSGSSISGREGRQPSPKRRASVKHSYGKGSKRVDSSKRSPRRGSALEVSRAGAEGRGEKGASRDGGRPSWVAELLLALTRVVPASAPSSTAVPQPTVLPASGAAAREANSQAPQESSLESARGDYDYGAHPLPEAAPSSRRASLPFPQRQAFRPSVLSSLMPGAVQAPEQAMASSTNPLFALRTKTGIRPASLPSGLPSSTRCLSTSPRRGSMDIGGDRFIEALNVNGLAALPLAVSYPARPRSVMATLLRDAEAVVRN